MSKKDPTIVGLMFRKQDKVATVISDGSVHATYTDDGRIIHPSMARGIAYLEAHGYRIDTAEFINL